MPQLDGLRAFAVVAVLIQHYLPDDHWTKFFPWGRVGVKLFFVLSGFLITEILLRAREQAASGVRVRSLLGAFYARRFLRIVPIYFATVAALAVLNIDQTRELLVYVFTYTLNFLVWSRDHWVGVLTPYWSLSVEEQFYLFWPWVVLFTPRRWLYPVMIGMFISALLWRSYSVWVGQGDIAVMVLTISSLDSLIIGALLALSRHATTRELVPSSFVRICAWIGWPSFILAIVLYVTNTKAPAFRVLFDTSIALPACWIVDKASSGFRGLLGKVLSAAPITYIGKISYGIYVIHLAVYILLPNLLFRFGFAFNQDRWKWFWLPSLATIILASLSWELFESRLNSLKQYFPMGEALKLKKPTLRFKSLPLVGGDVDSRSWEFKILLATAVGVLVALAFGSVVAYEKPFYDHSTGTWFVLADDLLHGILYRPAVSDLGFGGTRYMPLFVYLIAWFKSLGMSFVGATLMVNIVSAAIVVAVSYSLLRFWEVPRRLARFFAIFAIGSIGTHYTWTHLRVDIVPVALGLIGLRLCVSLGKNLFIRLAFAACAFALAFSAKISAMFWVFAVCAYLIVNRRFVAAIFLAALTLTLTAGMFGLVQWQSDGRFLEIMRLCVDGGDSKLRLIVMGIHRIDVLLRGSDPVALVFFVAAAILVVIFGKVMIKNADFWLFAALTAMTVMILGSTGTIENHLIDIYIASLFVVARNYQKLRAPLFLTPLVLAFYLLGQAALADREHIRDAENINRSAAIQAILPLQEPILSENAAVPLLAGRKAVVADAFMLRVLRGRVAEVDRTLIESIEKGVYKAIVLTHLEEKPDDWYTKIHFGPGFLEAVQKNYSETQRFGTYHIFEPKKH